MSQLVQLTVSLFLQLFMSINNKNMKSDNNNSDALINNSYGYKY